MERFSSRHGFQPDEAPISVTNDAPWDLRGVVVDIAYEAGLAPHSMRSVVCSTLRVREDPGNWSAYPNVDGEVRGDLDNCQWYEVYDIVEAVYQSLVWAAERRKSYSDREVRPALFESEINTYFRKNGIGWQLSEGQVTVRGDLDFEATMATATTALAEQNRATAANEIRQAVLDLSRRPQPDVTGALQHGLAALECVMRDVCGDSKATLGALLSRNKGLIPAPLDQGVEKIWGFASEQGRHLREGRESTLEEAELAVHVAAAVAKYVARKHDG